ncbi:hypothetical protein [Methanofollis ethanolicus]|uniref:hypothetical protein n=1 Tax=Methanofollis ethanolicus TaxID=488124 RepID=UPI00082DF8C9|nr:hypothetical protein [Methanofollis ethanolicus]
MKGKLAIGAALLLCLALVSVVPAAAASGQDGKMGQQACWQNTVQESTSAGACPCAEEGTCQQYRTANQTRSANSSGAGVCDATCDQTRSRQRLC